MKYIAGSDFKLSWIYSTDYFLMNQFILCKYYYKKLVISLNLFNQFVYLMGSFQNLVAYRYLVDFIFQNCQIKEFFY